MTADRSWLQDAFESARRDARDEQEHTSPPHIHPTGLPAWASWPRPERTEENGR